MAIFVVVFKSHIKISLYFCFSKVLITGIAQTSTVNLDIKIFYPYQMSRALNVTLQ